MERSSKFKRILYSKDDNIKTFIHDLREEVLLTFGLSTGIFWLSSRLL